MPGAAWKRVLKALSYLLPRRRFQKQGISPTDTTYAQRHTYEVWDLGRGGERRSPLFFSFSAHGWEKNYQPLYDTPGTINLPVTAERIKYPLRLIR